MVVNWRICSLFSKLARVKHGQGARAVAPTGRQEPVAVGRTLPQRVTTYNEFRYNNVVRSIHCDPSRIAVWLPHLMVPTGATCLHVHLPEGNSGASLKSRAGGKLPLRKAQGKETTAAGAHSDKGARRVRQRWHQKLVFFYTNAMSFQVTSDPVKGVGVWTLAKENGLDWLCEQPQQTVPGRVARC